MRPLGMTSKLNARLSGSKLGAIILFSITVLYRCGSPLITTSLFCMMLTPAMRRDYFGRVPVLAAGDLFFRKCRSPRRPPA